MAHVHKQLGQLRPANTTAASLYSPGSGVEATIRTIIICNQSGASAKFRLFHDDDGTTYDATTALYWDVTFPADDSVLISLFIGMNDENGNLGFRTDTANALTATCWGAEIS